MSSTQLHSVGATGGLASTYLDWTTEQIMDLFGKLEILEQDLPPSPAALLREIHDRTHNIKGLGGSFGYHLLTDVAASLCFYVRQAEEEVACNTKVLRAHIEALNMIIEEKISGSGGEPGSQLLSRLKEMGV